MFPSKRAAIGASPSECGTGRRVRIVIPRTIDSRQTQCQPDPSRFDLLADPKDPMDKPDPYAEWVLLAGNQDPGSPRLALDEELLAAARKAWPHVLAHVRGRLLDKELGRERTALAAEVWERVLLSVAKTRLRNKDLRSPIMDLESYLIGAFHHRLNRTLKKEQKRTETIEAFSSVLELEQFDGATDAEWVEQLERAIAARQVIDRMNPWMKKVWQRRQCDYSWKAIAAWLGVTEQQAKMKFTTGCKRSVRASRSR
jgi:DNA-directed RNA polymerase specialized sigma24 family protein